MEEASSCCSSRGFARSAEQRRTLPRASSSYIRLRPSPRALCPQELYLESNQLKQLPSDLGGLTQLRKLYLDDNAGLKAPEEILKLPCMASSHDYTLTAKALEGLSMSAVQPAATAPIGPGGDSHQGFLLEARTEAWK